MQVSNRVADFQAECCESVYEGLMNRCFINALKKNVPLSPEMAKECVDYSTQVLRNAGGISLLMKVIESADVKTKNFLTRISNECVEIGCEMSKDMILSDAVRSALEESDMDVEPIGDEDGDMNMPDPEETTLDEEIENLDGYGAPPEMPKEFKNKDISEIQLDTKITSKELEALKKAATNTSLDDISGIISDKVGNVLQVEKVQRFKLNEEKERLKTAIMDSPKNAISDENAAESAMERMLAIPTSNLDTSVYTTLFSTLQRRAVESVLAYENTNMKVSDILTELTVNNTFPIFRPLAKTFESVLDRAAFMTAAMECTDDGHMDEVIQKATTFATIVYTMMEMLHTTKLNSCSPKDVKDMVTKNAKDVAPTNDVANVINSDYKRAIECNKRRIFKCKEASDADAIRAHLINTKANLLAAKESGIDIKDDVVTQISNLIDLATDRYELLSKPAEESVFIDRMASARSADLGNLNMIASVVKYKNFDNVKFKCVESSGNNASFDVYVEKGKDRVYTSRLNVSGMESVEPEKYVKYLVSKSKFNDITTKDNQPLDYAVIYDGHITAF